MPERPPRVVKFVKAEVESIGNGRCQAKVELKRDPNRLYTGVAEGPEADNLLCVAQATAAALVDAASAPRSGPSYEIRINEIGLRDAFGKQSVLVSIAGSLFKQKKELAQERELIGVCLVEGDPVRAAALSVMSATNRFLGVG